MVRETREPLVAALRDMSRMTDKGLDKVILSYMPVWEFSTEEAEKIADMLLRRAQSSEVAAMLVYQIISGEDWINLIAIFGPRITQTAIQGAKSSQERRRRLAAQH